VTDPANAQDATEDQPTNSAEHSAIDQVDSPASFEDQPVLAYVEVDRFCTHCAYNLRGRPVRREAVTQLLLTSCPECGRFAEANYSTLTSYPWLKRFLTALLLLWSLFLVLFTLWESFIQVFITIATADESRYYLQYAHRYDGSRNWEMIFMIIGAFVGSVALSALLVGFMTVVAPHWKRWGYYALILARPPVVVAAAAIAWSLGWPKYSDFIFPFLGMTLTSVFIGGLIGLFLARPMIRLFVQLAIPKRFILPLSYLWTVDGKIPPGTKSTHKVDQASNP